MTEFQNYFKNFKFLAVIFSFSLLVFSLIAAKPVIAAKLYFEPSSQELGVGQEFQVDLMLDPQGKEINAVAATLSFLENLVEVVEIRDGSSILTFWVEKSALHEGKISFAGIVPGGFVGIIGPFEGARPGKVLEVVLKAISVGSGEIVTQESEIFLHDGLGTKVETTVGNFQFSIAEDIEVVSTERTQDTTPPESFILEITQHPEMFDDQYFLVFSTTDKDSGIAYYAIHESKRARRQIDVNEWIIIESPYLLQDQGLRSYIYVKVVDRAGNERIEVLEPQNPIKWHENYLTWIIIILGFAIVYLMKILWKKYLKK